MKYYVVYFFTALISMHQYVVVFSYTIGLMCSFGQSFEHPFHHGVKIELPDVRRNPTHKFALRQVKSQWNQKIF